MNITVLILIIFLISFFIVKKRSLGFLHPFNLFSFVYLMYYFIPALIISFGLYDSRYYFTYESHITTAIFIALLFYLIFVISLPLGEAFSHVLKIPLSANKPFEMNIYYLCVVLVLLAIYSKFYLFASGLFFVEDRFRDSLEAPQIILFFNNIHLISLMFLTVGFVLKDHYMPSSRRIIGYIFYFIFIFSVVVALLQGRRFGVLFPFIVYFIIGYYYGRFSIGIGRFLLLLFFSFLVFFSVTLLRLSQTMAFESSSINSIFDIIIFLIANFGVVFSSALEGILGRIGNSFIILNHVAFVRSEFGWVSSFDTFNQILSSLVPRVFWPEKPLVSIGNVFGRELFLLNELNYVTKINPGWVGEFFYNSFCHLIFGAVFFAFISSFFYRFFIADGGMLGGVLLVNYFIFIFSGMQMEVSFSLNAFVKSTFICLLLFFLSGAIKFISARGR